MSDATERLAALEAAGNALCGVVHSLANTDWLIGDEERAEKRFVLTRAWRLATGKPLLPEISETAR